MSGLNNYLLLPDKCPVRWDVFARKCLQSALGTCLIPGNRSLASLDLGICRLALDRVCPVCRRKHGLPFCVNSSMPSCHSEYLIRSMASPLKTSTTTRGGWNPRLIRGVSQSTRLKARPAELRLAMSQSECSQHSQGALSARRGGGRRPSSLAAGDHRWAEWCLRRQLKDPSPWPYHSMTQTSCSGSQPCPG